MSKITRWYWAFRLHRAMEAVKHANCNLAVARFNAACRTAPAILRSPEHKTLLLCLERSERCWAKWSYLRGKIEPLPKGLTYDSRMDAVEVGE